jgi:polyvinyl alcohol dehydrogenase (cytochrome)
MRRSTLVPAVAVAVLSVVGCDGSNDANVTAAVDQWTMLAYDPASTYHNRGERTLSPSNVGELQLDWHFVAPGSVNGAAAVVNGVIYVLSGGGLFALDPASRMVLWQNPNIRGTSSPTYDNGTLFVHTGGGEVVAVDPADGSEHWRADVDPHPLSVGFSSPLVFERYVIIGSSSIEEAAVAQNATFRGGMVAFDRDTGAELWRYYTVEPPFNGAGVWSSPSVDSDTRTVFGSTGNNYTELASDTSDAIFALDVDTGAVRWLTQLTEGDIFTILNPQSEDTDFGTNPILYEATVNGVRRKLVAAGQKSGVFWALDRETGEVVWSNAVSPGSALIGGFLNNGAYDGERIIAAGSRGSSTAPGSEEPNDNRRARLVALDPGTGAIIWERQIGGWVWAPITIANGVGYVAVDTTLQAFDTRTGEKLFTFPTAGTITSAPAVAEGRVHFGSGVSYFGTIPARDFFVLSLDGRGAVPTPTPEPPDTTFSAIYADIFVAQGCTTASCHGTNQGNLLMSSRDEAYANLVNVPAAGPLCSSAGLDRVEPGDLARSLLYDKLTATLPMCGDPMPPSGPLPEESIARIRAWIEDGAPDN